MVNEDNTRASLNSLHMQMKSPKLKGILPDLFRGHSQKFQNVIFLHLFVALPLETHFSKGIKQKSYQGEITAIFP